MKTQQYELCFKATNGSISTAYHVTSENNKPDCFFFSIYSAHTVPISLRFSQSSYSQSESLSPLSVSLVLDSTSGVAEQAVVARITASSQAGDTATGEKSLLLECVHMVEESCVCAAIYFSV